MRAAVLVVLLMQGCQQDPAPLKEEAGTTNLPVAAQITNQTVVETTNAPVAPSNAPPDLATTDTPASPPTVSAEYTIASSDTLSQLAKTFHTMTKNIIEANPGLKATRLQIGQKIRLPSVLGAAPTNEVPASLGDSGATTAGESTYTVKSGDCLLKIAAEFGTTVKAIRGANGLRTDRIDAGQKLKLPAKPGLRGRASAG
jgi:LysM repeat protein